MINHSIASGLHGQAPTQNGTRPSPARSRGPDTEGRVPERRCRGGRRAGRPELQARPTPYPQAADPESGWQDYPRGRPRIYYHPNGNDWGTVTGGCTSPLWTRWPRRPLRHPGQQRRPVLEPYHAQRVADMRGTTSPPPTAPAIPEDTYSGREEWARGPCRPGLPHQVVAQQAPSASRTPRTPHPVCRGHRERQQRLDHPTAGRGRSATPRPAGRNDEHHAAATGAYAGLTFTGT